ncbi:TPA: hypothetical protein G8065_003891 [Salmonella enterica]|uniref:Uncharacterized protein n=1 Tax=Salmonella enterica TaxID=28901 RepID=A0A762DBZ6_SALER|nr:hypothetical protein [Salmonella enterica]
MFNPLDNKKAAEVFPFYNGEYDVPAYVKPGAKVTFALDSREQELTILAAYDYGIEALNDEGREQLNRLIADLKVAITGR